MGCGRVFLVLISLVVIFFAYYLGPPVPDTIADRGMYRVIRMISNVLTDMGAVAEFVGITTQVAFEYKGTLVLANLAIEPDPNIVKVTDEVADSIPVRMHRPVSGAKDGRGLVYTHGGGMRFGCPKACDSLLSKLAARLDAVVMAIDYRKAPVFPSPIPVQDSEKAARYFFAHAQDYGVDPNKIGIAGESGGGTLAAVLTQRFRDIDGSPQFKYQVLIQPWTQGLDLHLPSYQQNNYHTSKILSLKGMARFLLCYFNQSLEHVPAVTENRHVSAKLLEKYRHHLDWTNIPKELVQGHAKSYTASNIDEDLAYALEEELQNPYNFPLMADNLNNLPPAFVLFSEADSLRDDAILYAHRLEQDGGHVERYYDNAGFHGIVSAIEPPLDTEAGLTALDAIVTFVLKHV